MSQHTIEILDGPSFFCPDGQRLLIAMEEAGRRDIFVGCRGGGCGVCKVKVVSGNYGTGKMSRLKVSEDEESAGYALACRLYPLEDLVIELAHRQ